MLRISDCRMSGTAFGTVVLHCCPEAATGGNLGLVHAAKGDDAVVMAVPLSFDSLSAILRDETSKEVGWC